MKKWWVMATWTIILTVDLCFVLFLFGNYRVSKWVENAIYSVLPEER